METIKPDQERVKNLLLDTVTLLCKNSLQFENYLRVEGLLGVAVDEKDTFFLHISERFQSDAYIEKLEKEREEKEAAARKEQEEKEAAERKEAEQNEETNNASRDASEALAVKVKMEAHEQEDDDDDLVITGSSGLHSPNTVAQPATMIAGQRRAQRRPHSPSNSVNNQTDSGDYGPTQQNSPFVQTDSGDGEGSFSQFDQSQHIKTEDWAEPPAKRQSMSNPWPNVTSVGDISMQAAQTSFQDAGDGSFGGGGGDLSQPGCSAWPTSLQLQQSGSQDSDESSKKLRGSKESTKKQRRCRRSTKKQQNSVAVSQSQDSSLEVGAEFDDSETENEDNTVAAGVEYAIDIAGDPQHVVGGEHGTLEMVSLDITPRVEVVWSMSEMRENAEAVAALQGEMTQDSVSPKKKANQPKKRRGRPKKSAGGPNNSGSPKNPVARKRKPTTPPEIALTQETGPKERSFLCTICGNNFTTVKGLKQHMVVHDGKGKTHLCAECGQTFVHQRDLTRHAKKHALDLPFKCQFCGKGYPRSDMFKMHLYNHRHEMMQQGPSVPPASPVVIVSLEQSNDANTDQ